MPARHASVTIRDCVNVSETWRTSEICVEFWIYQVHLHHHQQPLLFLFINNNHPECPSVASPVLACLFIWFQRRLCPAVQFRPPLKSTCSKKKIDSVFSYPRFVTFFSNSILVVIIVSIIFVERVLLVVHFQDLIARRGLFWFFVRSQSLLTWKSQSNTPTRIASLPHGTPMQQWLNTIRLLPTLWKLIHRPRPPWRDRQLLCRCFLPRHRRPRPLPNRFHSPWLLQ